MTARARTRRFLIRKLPPLLLIVAIAAYATMLYAAHAASLRASVVARYVQRLAESADERSNVIANAKEGDLLLEPLPRGSAHARWRLPSLASTLVPGTVVESEAAFVTGLDISLFQPDSEAVISLDGKRIGRFRPLIPSTDDEGPYTIAHAPLDGIDAPPYYTTGFRFPLVTPGACVTSGCTLRIAVKDTTWVVRRVGLAFTVRPPVAPALWKRPSAAWIVVALALGLAAFSHLVLSARFGRADAAAPR